MIDKSRVIDFVARGDDPNEWKLVLVETGPWQADLDAHLRALQERLYNCIDAVIDGKVAEQFPDTAGRRLTIQVDCYNLPRREVESFFHRFSSEVFNTADYRDADRNNPFVSKVQFAITFDSIH